MITCCRFNFSYVSLRIFFSDLSRSLFPVTSAHNSSQSALSLSRDLIGRALKSRCSRACCRKRANYTAISLEDKQSVYKGTLYSDIFDKRREYVLLTRKSNPSDSLFSIVIMIIIQIKMISFCTIRRRKI